MDDSQSWLFLLHSRIGYTLLKSLVARYGSAAKVIAASDVDLKFAGLSAQLLAVIRQPPDLKLKQQLQWLQRQDHNIIPFYSSAYPAKLRQIANFPLVIFVKGNIDLLKRPGIAIVGSRNPGVYGRKIAREFAVQLSDAGFIVISGLASGIDKCAHQGALVSGQTIAVLGNGLDVIYPAGHKELTAEIAGNGALISEFSPGTPPRANHFPRRNRIISGLSLGVLVVEAAIKSGSLITARYAVEQGREVYAIPGPIHSPLSTGNHYLIKQGAKLVESIADIIEELPQEVLPKSSHISDYENNFAEKGEVENVNECAAILKFLSRSPQTLDEIIELSGLTAETVSSMLLILEVQGIVSSCSGQYTIIN